MTLKHQLILSLVILLALGLGTAVQKRLPDPGKLRWAPFVHEAPLGTPVKLRTGQFKVLSVDAAPTLSDRMQPLAIATKGQGIFLVVETEYLASKVPGGMANLKIRSMDGRTFGGSMPVGGSYCIGGQPGIAIRCQAVFELSRNALVGAKLRATADVVADGRGDDVALIDLGITPALARELNQRTRTLRVRPESLVEERQDGQIDQEKH